MKLMLFVFSIFLLTGCGSEPQPDSYRVIIEENHNQSNWNAIKYNRFTGEAWSATSGTWKKLLDSEEVEKSDYEIKLVPLKRNWGAVRINLNTGMTWRAKKGKWVAMPELVPTS